MKPCTKWETKRLKTYYEIFQTIVGSPRRRPKEIAKIMGRSGRGRSPSTIRRHYLNMKEKKITKEPIMILKPFAGCENNVFLLRKKERQNVSFMYHTLRKIDALNFVVFVAGDFDYFVTTREKTIDFEQLDLEIVDKSILYTPLFTIPKGWNKPVNECIDSILIDFVEKKKIPREVNASLNWKKDYWNIYCSMRGNIRKPFAKVGKETNLDHKTVKKYFYETVLPCCAVNYYFFPHGFDTYRQTLLQITTDYETELVKAFENLSCTTYIYPFEKEIWVNVFHRDCNRLMKVVQALEEIGVVEKYKGYTPICCEEI